MCVCVLSTQHSGYKGLTATVYKGVDKTLHMPSDPPIHSYHTNPTRRGRESEAPHEYIHEIPAENCLWPEAPVRRMIRGSEILPKKTEGGSL